MSLLLALTATGGATFTLSADGATYAYSAGAANLVLNRTLVADGASYAYGAGAANFVHGRVLVPDGASYAYAAGAANFTLSTGATFTLLADGATYAYSAGAANFTLATDILQQFTLGGGAGTQSKAVVRNARIKARNEAILAVIISATISEILEHED